MINPDTIEDIDDYDGESVHAYGFDPTTGQWCWRWLSVERLYEAGRGDILARLFPSQDEAA